MFEIAKLLGPAIALEVGASAVLLFGQTGREVLLAYLATHAVASVLIAIAGARLLPQRFREPVALVRMMVFSIVFFAPFAGPVAFFSSLIVGTLMRGRRRAVEFATLAVPEYTEDRRQLTQRFGQGGMQARLSDARAPLEMRMKALLTLEGLPARKSSPMLRELLSSRADDLRLIAYGLLDSREKAFTAQIHEEADRLRAARDDAERGPILLRLASLYWELVYQKLSHGELRLFSLSQAERYAAEARRLMPANGGAQALYGRILLEAGKHDQADEALALAVALGEARARALPYLAEIAFQRRDFNALRALVREVAEGQFSRTLAPLIVYWSGRGR